MATVVVDRHHLADEAADVHRCVVADLGVTPEEEVRTASPVAAVDHHAPARFTEGPHLSPAGWGRGTDQDAGARYDGSAHGAA